MDTGLLQGPTRDSVLMREELLYGLVYSGLGDGSSPSLFYSSWARHNMNSDEMDDLSVSEARI